MLGRLCRLGLALASLAAPAAVAAQGTFEGLVVGSFSTDGKTIPFRYSQLGSRVRQEYTIEKMTAMTIYDGTTGDMIWLMPEQRKYMVMNLRQASGTMRQMAGAMGGRNKAPDFTKMKVTPTGKRETIAGLACEHYLFENTEDKDHTTVDMCGAKGLGFMGMAGEIGTSMPSTIALLRSQNPALVKLAREGFFPLRMSITGKSGKPMEWLVTQVDRRRPDASLFQPPAGYSEMTIPGAGGKH